MEKYTAKFYSCKNLHHIITFQFNSMMFIVRKSTVLAYICMHTNSVLPHKPRMNHCTQIILALALLHYLVFTAI